MIVTEEEAKTKGCQETFAPIATADRVYDDHEAATNCIGSACMAWRWRGMRSKNHPERLYDSHTAMTNAHTGKADDLSVAVGYCGKAGKP